MSMSMYDTDDVGCWADGAFGPGHVRDVLARLVGNLGYQDLAAQLNEPMSDDASEEYDALDILQSATAPGLHWELDGDLVLR